MPRFKLLIEYAGTVTAAGRSRKTPARCRAKSTGGARGLPAAGVRAVRSGPNGRRRPCARPGRAPGALYDLPARIAAAEDQRRAAGRHPHPAVEKRRTAFTRGTMRSRAATCIRFRAAARRSGSPTCGGFARRSTSRPCGRRPRSFVGMSDFAAFTADDPDEKSTLRSCSIEPRNHRSGGTAADPRGGSHFLWKMVRRMVGVLAACGRGELSPGKPRASSMRAAKNPRPRRRLPRQPPACFSKRSSTRGTRRQARCGQS